MSCASKLVAVIIPIHKLDTTSWPATASAPQEIARLYSFKHKPTEFPPPVPTATTFATERVEQSTPFCAAASSIGALPTPSRLSERHPYFSGTWNEKEHADDAHNTSAATLARIMSCSQTLVVPQSCFIPLSPVSLPLSQEDCDGLNWFGHNNFYPALSFSK